MKRSASVSVIIPAYNVETCLHRAVLSALGQVPPPLEVIVINDGSTDKTAEVALNFGDRIRYLEQSNQGPASARNAGMAVASGKYVAFLDADDYWLPGFIKATVGFMEANPEAVAVSTGWQYQPLKGDVKEFPSSKDVGDIPRHPLVLEFFFDFWGRYNHVLTGTVLLRRSKLGNNDFQRTDLRICEDLEFWGYLGILGSWGFIPEAYWFGDSARVAITVGWLSKYRLRRILCPTVESWQARILPNLKDADWPGFRMVRGQVASNYAHSMILAGRFSEARRNIRSYGLELPKNWVTRLMRFGYRSGVFGWWIICCLFLLREYQKGFFHVLSKRNNLRPLLKIGGCMPKSKVVSDHYLSESGKNYYDRWTSGYELGRMVQSEYFLPYMDNEKVILDFGCSDGLFLRHLPAKARIGVEVNATAREKCSILSEKKNISVELHESLETIEANRADVVISNHVLEHVLNPYETLVEIHRVLKPKGNFVIVVPFDDWRSKGHGRWKMGDHDNHLYTWSPLNLGNLLTEAGFSVLETKLCTRAWSPRFFWIHRFFGKKSFDIACWLFSLFKNRREVLCVAEKP